MFDNICGNQLEKFYQLALVVKYFLDLFQGTTRFLLTLIPHFRKVRCVLLF